MDQRIFHGDLTPNDLARALIGEFNRGNLRALQIGNNKEVIVQIATREQLASGGRTAMSITLRQVADGVSIEIGKQSWLGLIASLGETAFWTLRSPWNLLGRLDDIAQDIESLQLSDEVWRVVEQNARSLGASFELSERIRRLMCEYCLSANPVGVAACLACGAPLGKVQPTTCPNCGFIVRPADEVCENCGRKLGSESG